MTSNQLSGSAVVSAPKRKARRQLLVDRRMQLRVAANCASIAGMLGLACAAVMFLLPSSTTLERMTGTEARVVLMWTITAFFVAAIAVVASLAIVLTHRLAGPTRVIISAIHKMSDGDFGGRLRLRPNDYLRDLAAAAEELQTELKEAEAKRRDRELLLRELVERNDIEGLREHFEIDSEQTSPEAARA